MIDEQNLRELCSSATPGPWSFSRHTCGLNGEHDARDDWTVYGEDGDSVCTEGSAPALADPEFIASANPATITALLDELATLRQERTAWRVTAENAEKDAARYRWLQETFTSDDAWPDDVADAKTATQLDAAIDHATKETP